MDLYGISAPDFFRIDDLLDFSNDELFSSSTTADSDLHHHHFPLSDSGYASSGQLSAPNLNQTVDFTDDLCVPNDDIAELEWLSNFVDDSFTEFQKEEVTGTANFGPEVSFQGRSRSKRSRVAFAATSWASSPESDAPTVGKSRSTTNNRSMKKTESSSSLSPSSTTSQSAARKCTHCASEKTPQWRTGPLGPKTLCNACGVRYKSGRLVPEYRPAASPTFVLTQHSNSHRKVMELRRQKEAQRRGQLYDPLQDYEVC